ATASITAAISVAPMPTVAPPPPPPVISAPDLPPPPTPPMLPPASQPILPPGQFAPQPISTWQPTSSPIPPLTGPIADVAASGAGGFVATQLPHILTHGTLPSVAVQARPPDVTVWIGESGVAGSSFTLPDRTFVVLQYERATVTATLADGRPLPPWVQFDPNTGPFTVKPPAGQSGTLEVQVTATTESGQTASVDFEIRFESEAAEAAEATEAEQPQETAALPGGKPSLSEQLRAAGHDGVLAEVAALIESLVAT